MGSQKVKKSLEHCTSARATPRALVQRATKGYSSLLIFFYKLENRIAVRNLENHQGGSMQCYFFIKLSNVGFHAKSNQENRTEIPTCNVQL